MLSIHFLTLFPDFVRSGLEFSLLGKAQKRGLISYEVTQIRDFSTNKHRRVDDTPYGGGEGMLMRADVLFGAHQSALASLKSTTKTLDPKIATVLLSPQGQHLSQAMAKELSAYDGLILVCGHYEGVDERFIELCVDREVSIGDYVLTGGEIPALVVADVVTRLLPGVVGNPQSVTNDSLEDGLLKYPQYTRPREFQGIAVPDVLLGGDHAQINAWRKEQSEVRTARKRPDLVESKK